MSESVQSTDAPAAVKPINWMSVGVWVGVIAILAVLGWGLVNVNKSRPEETAPDFDMQFFPGYEWEGRPAASLNDMQGQVVVLNFWASWCVECRLEADLLEQTWRAYRDRGVIFLGIAYIDAEPNSLAYMKEFDITYPNAPDLRSAISSDYEITGVPETFFIGKTGRVEHIQIGPLDQPTLVGLLERLLAQ
ncbi:MAG: TlpA disulfide reductase family protein [Chloroflexota bacterium]